MGRPPVVIGGGTNINIWLGNSWRHRPGWGHSWHHGHWHHGHWNHWGHWNSGWPNAWYRPSTSFMVGWGLGALSTGVVRTYHNPYFVTSSTTIYNYSQPLIVEVPVPVAVPATGVVDSGYSTARAAAPDPQPPANASLVTAGLDAFRQADFAKAVKHWDDAIQQDASDPALHELLALGLFATGEFQSSAAILNALLAVSPGMDWTTMSGLYGDIDLYTQQLRRLESHIEQHRDDAAAMFVLAYHYLVTSAYDEAKDLLEAVVKLQPADQVAAKLLAGLTQARSGASQPAAGDLPPPSGAATPDGAAPSLSLNPAAVDADAMSDASAEIVPDIDLDWIGNWKADDPRVTIELSVDDQFQFTWRTQPRTAEDEAPVADESVALTGELLVDGDFLVLESPEHGAMVGRVPEYDDNQFRFVIIGSPEDDPGLTFKRQE